MAQGVGNVRKQPALRDLLDMLLEIGNHAADAPRERFKLSLAGVFRPFARGVLFNGFLPGANQRGKLFLLRRQFGGGVMKFAEAKLRRRAAQRLCGSEQAFESLKSGKHPAGEPDRVRQQHEQGAADSHAKQGAP